MQTARKVKSMAIRSAQSTTVILDVCAIISHLALTILVIAKERCEGGKAQ